MANLTISVDAETLKRARIRALERGESVNRVLAEALRSYAGADAEKLQRQREALARTTEIADRIGKGSRGERWTREELYDPKRIGLA